MTLVDANVQSIMDEKAGDDYFMYETFACVDSNTSNYWNGRLIDSKAKRRLEVGDVLVFIGSARNIDTSGVGDENLDIGLNLRHLLKFN